MKFSSVVVLSILCIVHGEISDETKSADQCEMPSDSKDCFQPHSGYAFNPKLKKCVWTKSCDSRELFFTKGLCEHDCSELLRPKKSLESKICGLVNTTDCNNPAFFGWIYNEQEEKCLLRRSCALSNVFESKVECMEACYAKETVSDLVCKVPPESGPCMAAIRRWSYNPMAKGCESFIYGGCRGNLNNFDTQEECEHFCQGVVAIGMIHCGTMLKDPKEQENKRKEK